MRNPLRRLIPERWQKRSTPAADEDFWYLAVDAIRQAAAGIRIDAESAMQCSVFRAALDGLASDLATIPFPVYRRGDDVSEKAINHPLYNLLQKKMNPEMSATDGRSLWVTHKYQYGDAYSWIETTSGGRPVAIWPMQPPHVFIRRDPNTRVLLYDWHPPNERKYTFLADEILHFKDLTKDGITSRKLVEDGKDSIALAIAAERFAGYFFGNGANIGNVIETDGNFDDPSFERLVQQLSKRSGLAGSHKPLVLEGGAKLKQAMIDPRQAQTAELLRIAGEQVMRLFRMQPTMVQDNERATFSNVNAQSLNHVKFTLRPPAVRIEKELDIKFFQPSDWNTYYTKHNFDGILRGDIEARSTYYKVMVAAGIMTRNEARILEDLAPVEGGDEPWVPVNSMPLSGPLPNQKQEPTDADPGNEGGADNEPQD